MVLRNAVDNLCIYDPEFSGHAEAFQKDLGGGTAIVAIQSMDDLKSAIENFSNIRFLDVCLHGTPGMIYFANRGAMVGSYFGTLTQGSPFLNKGARILFESCEIGKGAEGDKFMDDLAKTMLLGKGGIIGASTVTNYVFMPKSSFSMGAFLAPFSGGTLKVRQYDVNGNRIGSRSVNRYGSVVH